MTAIGPHQQTDTDRQQEAWAAYPAGTPFKAIDRGDILRAAKGVNPDLKTILRHWYDPDQVFGGSYADNQQRARRFLDSFVDATFIAQYAPFVDFIEGWNEYNAASHNVDEVAQRVRWVQALVSVWAREYQTRPDLARIELIAGNVAVGNDFPVEAARACVDYGAVVGYHPYIAINPGGTIHAGDWQWYSGRHALMDATYQAAGIHGVRYMFTEGGPVLREPSGHLNGQAGWRHPDVYNGQLSGYLDALHYWAEKVNAWNAANGNRVLGLTLFTTGGGSQWRYFETRQPEMGVIAAQDFGGVTPPPPPPPFAFTHWPTEFETITQPFGANPEYYAQFGLPGHEGVDIRAPHGSPIFAAHSGTVSDVNGAVTAHNYGIFIRVKQGKHETTYAHLERVAALAVGQPVSGGDVVGWADDTGNSRGSHLHLTLKSDDAYPGGPDYIDYPHNIIDPTVYIEALMAPPPPPPPTGSITRTFELGWETLTDRLQQPANFALTVIPAGDPLWYGARLATGTVEAKHLRCSLELPPHQCAHGSDPLILDGVTTYKAQAVEMAAGTSLKTTFNLSGRCRVTVPVNVHYQGGDPYDRVPPLEGDDVYAALILNGETVQLMGFPALVDREWVTLAGEVEGPVTAELRLQTSYANSRDIFTDRWVCEQITTPPPPPPVGIRRVVHLPAQDITYNEYQQVTGAAWTGGKQTVSPSADDAAALYNLPDSRADSLVIVWWAERWEDSIDDWLMARGVTNIEHRP